MHERLICVAECDGEEGSRLCEDLRRLGYGIIAAANGEAAVAICREQPVALLIAGCPLPDIECGALRARLDEHPESRNIPVLFGVPRGVTPNAAIRFCCDKPYNLPVVMMCVDRMLGTNPETQEPLTDNSYTDPLTGLRNRRFLSERLDEELQKASRYNTPLSCLFAEINDVEAVDGELGSVSLDDLMAEMAFALRSSSRVYDILARFDGSLFAAVLPHTPLDAAIQYARKIREEVSSTTFSDPAFPTRAQLTFGIVTTNGGPVEGSERVLSEAMRNLLHASAGVEHGIVARYIGAAPA